MLTTPSQYSCSDGGRIPSWHHPGFNDYRRLLTSSQCILEDLLEAQELQDGQVDSWVKSETALVWAESRVELDTISAVDLGLQLVIFPDDTELNDALGD
jgi:hypothetical protein